MRLVDGYTLAAFLGVSPATIRKWASRGHIQAVRRDRRRALYDATEVLRHAGTVDRLAA